MKILLPITWTLWIGSMAWMSYITYLICTERTQTADSIRAFGLVVMLFVFLAVGAIGPALWWAGRRESSSAVIAILILLCLPGIAMIFGKSLRFASGQKIEYDLAKEGDFADPQAKQIAAAIVADDVPALKALLATGPDLNKRDRADNSLLDFAIRRFRFMKGNPEDIQLLLTAGANPNAPSANSGTPPLMEMGEFPELVRSLVQAGANIEVLSDENPAVLRFTRLRQWESAIYLVQNGARLDTATPNGLSIYYFLKQWEGGVEGVPTEGWDRLRAAIAKRRKSGSN